MRPVLSRDLPASLVVFLVALPLSLGISVASGVPVQAGLIAATVGGVVVGLLGGAPLQVSGPAAGLTVMVYGFVQQFGLKALGVVVVLAGLMQVSLGLLRVARAALAISPAVLHAMLAGIGILISLGQVHVLLGGTPQTSAWANLAKLPEQVMRVNGTALAVGVLTLGVLVGWNRFVAKRVKALPGSLVAIVAGTLASLVLPGQVSRVTLGAGLLSGISLPNREGHGWESLVLAALALTLVASAESLLCAVATDQLHGGPRADLDRELFAQGVGNTVSGLLGGLPITGVIVRSSANIAAGASTRWSATLHGVWVSGFALAGAGLLGRLPHAALAALLIHVGVNLVKVKELRRTAEYGEAAVYVATLLGVVFINLMWGIGIGFGFALLRLLRASADAQLELSEQGEALQAVIRGRLTFLSVPALTQKLREIAPRRTVLVRFELEQLDHAAVEAFNGWRIGYENAGGRVVGESLGELWRSLRKG
jgi:carbonic anhydrase